MSAQLRLSQEGNHDMVTRSTAFPFAPIPRIGVLEADAQRGVEAHP